MHSAPPHVTLHTLQKGYGSLPVFRILQIWSTNCQYVAALKHRICNIRITHCQANSHFEIFDDCVLRRLTKLVASKSELRQPWVVYSKNNLAKTIVLKTYHLGRMREQYFRPMTGLHVSINPERREIPRFRAMPGLGLGREFMPPLLLISLSFGLLSKHMVEDLCKDQNDTISPRFITLVSEQLRVMVIVEVQG